MEDPKNDEEVIAIQHPLENQVILDLVLAYLQPLATFEDWKNIRLVCRTWHFQTLAKWRATTMLNLKLGSTLHKDQPICPGVSMSEFLTLIENDHGDLLQFTDKPFRNYKLQNLVLDVFNVKKNNLFWTSVGPNIRHLSLHEVNIKTFTKTMKEVMEFLVNQIPNLESFAVSNVYIDGKRMNKPPRKILVVHPNVKTLRISNCFAFGFANFPNLQEVTLEACESKDMAALVKSNPPLIRGIAFLTNSSIERLTLDKCTLDARHFVLLRFTALKHLSVHRYIGKRTFTDNDFLALSKFTKNHAETLETIEAFGSLRQPALNSTCMFIENMPNLTEVRAWGNVFANFNFFRHTQNLKLLHLDLYGFEKQEKLTEDLSTGSVDGHWYITDRDPIEITNAVPLRLPEQISWRHLHYFQINCELKKESLKTLTNWMPNLKTFKTVLNKDTFPIVCEKWPELEHLECSFGSSILNENITGIDEGSLDGQRSKALIDMEYLTTFKLHAECNKSRLSDNCVAIGFLRVPKLVDLCICVSSEFSEDAEILLRRGIKSVQIYQNYWSNPLHNNWQCCRDSEYKRFILNRGL